MHGAAFARTGLGGDADGPAGRFKVLVRIEDLDAAGMTGIGITPFHRLVIGGFVEGLTKRVAEQILIRTAEISDRAAVQKEDILSRD